MKRKLPADLKAAAKEAAKRAALRALSKARRTAAKTGVDLSEWEGEFLGSVEDRVKTFGRAFADPEKGAPGAVFSALQHRKLKEIAAKAGGETKPRLGARPRRGFGRKRPSPKQSS